MQCEAPASSRLFSWSAQPCWRFLRALGGRGFSPDIQSAPPPQTCHSERSGPTFAPAPFLARRPAQRRISLLHSPRHLRRLLPAVCNGNGFRSLVWLAPRSFTPSAVREGPLATSVHCHPERTGAPGEPGFGSLGEARCLRPGWFYGARDLLLPSTGGAPDSSPARKRWDL